MRIVVFSDSHNNFPILDKITAARGDANLFLHCGDGLGEVEDLRRRYPGRTVHAVAGNCDWSVRGGARNKLLVLEGKRIFLTHGHLHRVKESLTQLTAAAKAERADIAVFGHTHRPLSRYRDGLYLFNPGSITFPRGGRPSYGVIDLTRAGVNMEIVEL